MAPPAPYTLARGVVLVRVVLGLLLALHGAGHLLATNGVPDLVAGADLSSPLFAGWGERWVAPHSAGLSVFLAWFEAAVGALLVLGAFVRPLATLLLLVLVLLFVASYDDAERELIALAAACALACVLSDAGRVRGLDALLDARLPRWLTWGGAPRG
ncbi:MAG: DoxX family membrane protein [Planctomycetes bacterium]|nr:DoxX family membrane protein [Planctomycetota bacterium]